MKKHFSRLTSTDTVFVIAIMIIMLALLAYGGYQYVELRDNRDYFVSELNKTQEDFASTTRTLVRQIQALEETLSNTQTENGNLTEALVAEKDKTSSFEQQIEDIASTVGTLDKLSKTDEELLQKYSKVYFLNEHYIPPKLTQIEKTFLYIEDKPQFIHTDVWPYLEDLLEEAEDDNIELFIASAYRSFETQTELKTGYVVTYGAGTANQFSADQGYSEHQLGTTVDFITTGIGGTLAGFGNTDAYEWLLDNAHRYGFTLSYPPNNTYYQFEPWHWRFVGTELARELHKNNQYFYDLEQRDIDAYLISIFD